MYQNKEEKSQDASPTREHLLNNTNENESLITSHDDINRTPNSIRNIDSNSKLIKENEVSICL